MKKFNIIFSLILVMVVFMISCQDDSHELEPMLDKSEIKFRVEQAYDIDEGGNTVILVNETPGTIPIWDYGTGRSNNAQDTVRFAFKGEYPIKLSVMTGGRVVEMDPIIVKVTKDELKYVNDPLWIALSGGVDQEKTWLLDLDENGVSKFFDGPQYFYGTDNGWEGECLVEEGDCWNWNPEWKGNQWLMPAGDYGTMTFSLKGGPFVTVDHKMIPSRGTETGTYYLDKDAKTLTLTDVTMLHDEARENCVVDYGNIRLFSLTENTMQLAVMRKSECDGSTWLVYNFISKEYSDNWVPEPEGPQEDPNFDHGADQKEILAVDKTTTKTWKLDTQVPFNWTNLEGGFLNEWNSIGDYPSWAPYNEAAIANIDEASISFSEDGTVVITNDDGTTQEGQFEVDEATNMITFNGVTPSIFIVDGFTATTTAENQWKIVKVERNEITAKVTGVWFGKRDPEKDEYMVFHFKLQSPEGAQDLTPEEIIMSDLAGSDSRTWQLSEQNPFDWTTLDGTFMNGWTSRAEYPDWAAFDDSHVEAMNDASIQFGTDGSVIVTQDDGTTSSGSFTIDGQAKKITFQEVTPAIPIGGWAVAEPTAEKEWKIILVERDANKAPTGIWFGKRATDKDEYMVFHFVLN